MCGSGNNAGDGYVFGAVALDSNVSVRLYRKSPPKTDESCKACDQYLERGGELLDLSDFDSCEPNDVIIDALFGIGLTRDIQGQYEQVVRIVNESENSVLSLDIPSGINADTGAVMGCAIKADLTVAFISAKMGLVMPQGRQNAGCLALETLNVPDEAYDKVEQAATVLDPQELKSFISPRKPDAHKGSVGRVLIVGGNATMEGAAFMAAHSAYRSGAGLVSVAMPANQGAKLITSAPEIRVFDGSDAQFTETLMNDCDVLGIGPGLGQDTWAQKIWQTALSGSARIVADADALNLLAKAPALRDDWVLTPHPGEAARLLNCSVKQVQSDRLEAARTIARRFGAVTVLKGAATLISNGKKTWICTSGNPGMATGGMGDVLTGIVCALWAQGLNALEAACTAVWLHAAAGDECAAQSGPVGMMATDLLPGVRRNLNRLMSETVLE